VAQFQPIGWPPGSRSYLRESSAQRRSHSTQFLGRECASRSHPWQRFWVSQVRRNVVPIAPPIFHGVARCEPLAALIEKLAGKGTGIAFSVEEPCRMVWLRKASPAPSPILLALGWVRAYRDGAVSCDESRRYRLGSKEWRIEHREKTPVHQCGCRPLIFAAWI